jgi:hypothetical protein
MKFYQSVVALTVMPNKLNIDSPCESENDLEIARLVILTS